jgi:hypothetical protein
MESIRMPIIINHITIAARDKKASTEWMTMLLRLSAGRVVEPFAFVELDEPTLDASIATMPRFKMQHVALRVIMISEATQLYLTKQSAGWSAVPENHARALKSKN